MKTKQDRIDCAIVKLKDLYNKGIIGRDFIKKFGKVGTRSPEQEEHRKKEIQFVESLLESSSIEEVLEKRNKSGLFLNSNHKKLKDLTLSGVKETAKKTIEMYKNEELILEVFNLGLEGELTREDLQFIINRALGEENGNN